MVRACDSLLGPLLIVLQALASEAQSPVPAPPLTTYSETGVADVAGSDPPITEATMTPPKTNEPARSGRKYFRNPLVVESAPSALGVPVRTPAGPKS